MRHHDKLCEAAPFRVRIFNASPGISLTIRPPYSASMAIRDVLKTGHALLREASAPVTAFGNEGLQRQIAGMDDTMRALDGFVIATPRIGAGLRVVIFEITSNLRHPQ